MSKRNKIKSNQISINPNENKKIVIVSNGQKKDIEDKLDITSSNVDYDEDNLNLCLDLLTNELNSESKRSSTLDNKIGFIFTVTAVYIPIMFNKLLDILHGYINTTIDFKIIFIFIMLSFSFISSIMAIIFLYLAILAKPVEHVDLRLLNNETLLKGDKRIVKRKFINKYHEITENNRQSNEKKAQRVNLAIKFILASFITFIISYIYIKEFV